MNLAEFCIETQNIRTILNKNQICYNLFKITTNDVIELIISNLFKKQISFEKYVY